MTDASCVDLVMGASRRFRNTVLRNAMSHLVALINGQQGPFYSFQPHDATPYANVVETMVPPPNYNADVMARLDDILETIKRILTETVFAPSNVSCPV